MRQTLITLLAVITLLSQWGWQAHDYQDHDHAEQGHICELCLSASGHAAITPSPPLLSGTHGSDTPDTPSSVSFIASAPRFYATRAPPRFL